MDIDDPRTRQHMQAGRHLRIMHVLLGGKGVAEEEVWTPSVWGNVDVEGAGQQSSLAWPRTPCVWRENQGAGPCVSPGKHSQEPA